jgi:alginate O-acetyltransferase complex protein AlgI
VVGVLAFSGQILCDFAGYSTCAVGVAASLGFRLPENFYAPYSARGFSDFWRRWHVSLSSWLRDYVYISLGGNRASPARTQVNLVLTMLIGGLWHGPSWTFVVWGGLHGFYLILERGVRAARIGDAWPPALAGMAAWVLTHAGVMLAWIFFRAADFTTAFHLVHKVIVFPADRSLGVLGIGEAVIAVVAVAGVYFAQQAFRHRTFEEQVDRMGRPALAAVIAVLVMAIATSSGNDRAFIYFQF